MPATSPSGPSDISSSRGSTKSSRQGSRVHFLMHDRGTSITEEDLQIERDYIYNLCLEAIKDMETDMLEEVRQAEKSTNIRIDEVIVEMQKELSSSMFTERTQRDTTLAEIRRDLGVQRDLQSQIMAAEATIAKLQDELYTVHKHLEFQAESANVADVALTDLRSELQAGREKQELEAETTQIALADLKHDLSTLQLAQVHGLQDQALQISSDVNRIQDMAAANAAGQGALRAELQHMVTAVRGELEQAGCASASHLARTEALEATTQAMEVKSQERTDMAAANAVGQGALWAELQHMVNAVRGELEQAGCASASHLARTEALEATTQAMEVKSQELTDRIGELGQLVEVKSQELTDRIGELGRLAAVGGGPSQTAGPNQPGAPPRAAAGAAADTADQGSDPEQLFGPPRPTAAREADTPCPAGGPPAGGLGLESSEEKAMLRTRLEMVESLCSSAELQSAVGDASINIRRLELDLAEERTERLRSLAHLGRLTEDLRLNSVQASLQSQVDFERANAELGARVGRLETALLSPRIDKLEERLGSIELRCEKMDCLAQAVRTINVIEQDVRQAVARGRGKGDSGEDSESILKAKSASVCVPPPRVCGSGDTAKSHSIPGCLNAADMSPSRSKSTPKDLVTEALGVSTYAAAGPTEEHGEAPIKVFTPEPAQVELSGAHQNAAGQLASHILSCSGSAGALRRPAGEALSPSGALRRPAGEALSPSAALRRPAGEALSPSCMARVLSVTSMTPWSAQDSVLAPKVMTRQSLGHRPRRPADGSPPLPVSNPLPRMQSQPSTPGTSRPTTHRNHEHTPGTSQPKLALGTLKVLSNTVRVLLPAAEEPLPA